MFICLLALSTEAIHFVLVSHVKVLCTIVSENVDCWVEPVELVNRVKQRMRGYRSGSPTAIQTWQPCPLWEPYPSHLIVLL